MSSVTLSPGDTEKSQFAMFRIEKKMTQQQQQQQPPYVDKHASKQNGLHADCKFSMSSHRQKKKKSFFFSNYILLTTHYRRGCLKQNRDDKSRNGELRKTVKN